MTPEYKLDLLVKEIDKLFWNDLDKDSLAEIKRLILDFMKEQEPKDIYSSHKEIESYVQRRLLA